MDNYLRHLQQLSNGKTFNRKKDYIDYNLSNYLKKVEFKNLKVLELGPGLGEFESYLNDKGVFYIDVIDNDKGVLGYVSQKYQINKAFYANNISEIDKKLGQYNFIFLMQVLEHLPVEEYSRALNILYNHLEKDGYLVIVVPNGNNPLGLTERYADLQHTSCFTEQSLRDLIDASKIQSYQITIKGYEIPPYSLINLIRIPFQKILHFVLLLLMIINGGVFFKTMTPNIMLVLKKQ